jgi:glycerol-3-phosphate acyltransferase PlsY
MNLALGLAIAYLVGSFPTAYLIGRARGVDLGAVGSGNYGATNVFRAIGPGPAIVALVVDVAKGYVPVALFPRWLPAELPSPMLHAVLLATAAVLGHVFSIFLKFRGGKGVGTAFGAYLALAPWAILAAALTWVVIVLATRIVSIASLVAAVVLLVGAIVVDPLGGGDGVLVAVTALLVVFVFWTHRDNIARLRRGEEKPIAAGRGGGS